MKRTLAILFIVLLGFGSTLKADEGMWLPMFIDRLNYVDLQEEGLNLTPEEIYSINNSSLKDAVIIFGGGCTGELVSDKGLVLTNHHCGYGVIQSHSTVEHDYLSDGFWAQSMEEELPNEGLTARFLVRMEDVTEQIVNELNNDMTETERSNKIREIANKIEEKATEENHYSARVQSFYKGNEFYLFIYETFKDVRLVGAPPSSIGKYGADTDNWMWPRHTGDFSVFRIYADKDGNPAEYSDDNAPLKPKHYLPISIAPKKENDFAMIMGYPGGTERYLTSHGVKLAIDQKNPTIVKIRDKKLNIMREDMDASKDIRIKYASKYARTANYWKYYIGQTKGLKNLDVYGKKQKLEDKFLQWVNQDPKRKEKYGETLDLIANAYKNIKPYDLSRWYFYEAVYRGSEIIGFSRNFSRLQKFLNADEPDNAKIEATMERIKERSKGFFKDYNAPTDQKLMAAMLEMYYQNVPMDHHPEVMREIIKESRGDFEAYAEDVFDQTIFSSKEKVDKFLANPKASKLERDPVIRIQESFFNKYRALQQKTSQYEQQLDKGYRLLVAGLREMNPEKNYYPDANFTMRLTHGNVMGYEARDAVYYDFVTTLDGVMEKEVPGDHEFHVPEKLKELYYAKDYGRYGEDGKMVVAFLTNHDITGGNSGSPVINGNGELIGIAFDGNWEAMSGDIAFEPELQRTINVDIRYVLFVIDKYAGAQRLIDEMDIVAAKPDRVMKSKKTEKAMTEEETMVE
ncbi:MAG: S46 family peptidase [Bacteroidales bacterium]|nr:S46 family peptidase [Bacteroidales bacterium]